MIRYIGMVSTTGAKDRTEKLGITLPISLLIGEQLDFSLPCHIIQFVLESNTSHQINVPRKLSIYLCSYSQG